MLPSQAEKINSKTLAQDLGQWMAESHCGFYGIKKIGSKQLSQFQANAGKLIEKASQKKTLCVFFDGKKPKAIVTRVTSSQPRIRHQQVISVFYKGRPSPSTLTWIRKQLRLAGQSAPRYTQIGLSPSADLLLGATMEKAGFHTRDEVLLGQTDSSLKGLMREKQPADNLDHLGLTIAPIQKVSQLPAVMRLQKQSASGAKKHTYFAHTPAQLKKDRAEYRQVILSKKGLLLGIFRQEKLI